MKGESPENAKVLFLALEGPSPQKPTGLEPIGDIIGRAWQKGKERAERGIAAEKVERAAEGLLNAYRD